MRSGMYLVIELLTGGMLRAKLRVRKIPVREVVEIRKYLAEPYVSPLGEASS